MAQAQYASTTAYAPRTDSGGLEDARPSTSAGFYMAGGSAAEEAPVQANSTMESIEIAMNYLKFGEMPEKETALSSLTQIITLHDNKLYL